MKDNIDLIIIAMYVCVFIWKLEKNFFENKVSFNKSILIIFYLFKWYEKDKKLL